MYLSASNSVELIRYFHSDRSDPYTTFAVTFYASDQASAERFSNAMTPAIQACSSPVRNYKFDPDKAIPQAVALMDLGRDTAGKQLFSAVEKQEPKSAATWNSLCWWGALTGQAQLALPWCDRAVTLASADELPGYRDSRGVTRALTGDLEGAIADFQFSLASAKENNSPYRSPPQMDRRAPGWKESSKRGRTCRFTHRIESARQDLIASARKPRGGFPAAAGPRPTPGQPTRSPARWNRFTVIC